MNELAILKTIIQNLDQPSLILDQTNKIIFYNQHFLKLINNTKIPDNFHLTDIILNYDYEVEFHDFETIVKIKRLNTKSNEVAPSCTEHQEKSIKLNQFNISNTNFKFLVVQDQTVLNSMRAEIEKVKKQSEDIVKFKTDFFASMSHELRTPLHFILGTINFLLKKEIIKKQYETKISLEMVKQSGQRLLELVNQILDLSKLDRKKEEINLDVFVLEEIIFGLKDMMKTLIGPKPVKFYLECDLSLQRHIYSDKRKINQVIVNLLSNAIKFTEKGRIFLNVYKLKDRLYFEVTDTGTGIAPEKLNSIFDPFVQVEGQQTLKYKGTGLGLAISRQYVEILGGDIWVESETQEGSTFIFWIPYIEKEPKKVMTKEKSIQESESSEINFINKNILICDDDNFNLTYLEMILKDRINFTLTKSGKELLKAANKRKFDLILIDIQMPEMDGLETLRRLKEIKLNKNTRTAALTAQAMQGDKESFLARGFNSYLSKPFSEEGLIDFIKSNLF